MATIGTFNQQGDGYTGSIKTLTLNVKAAQLRPNDKTDEKAPDYRIFSYVHRYGSLRKAFAAAGYRQPYVRSAGTHTVARADNASLAALEAANPVVVAALRRLFRDHGRITRTLIDAAPDLPSWRKVAVMFGGLETVFRLAGPWPETSRVRLGPRTVRA